MLDMRQLHYFVAVAEEEHVGRAAERLHISQSPLSRQIAQLEEKLGLVLFERNQQRIRLTADGRIFLAEAKAFLVHASRLESMARRLGRGDEGGLCIGYVDSAMHAGVLPAALRQLRTERPAIHIALYNHDGAAQLEGLRQRSLDVALLCQPVSEHDPDLQAAQVLDEPMLLALPAGHPLVALDEISAADLAAQKWIGTAQKDGMAGQKSFVAACARAGFVPELVLEAAETVTALGLVAANLGITMVQASLRQQAPDGVVLRELPWFDYRMPMWVAWHRVTLRPVVAYFRGLLHPGA